MKALYDPRMNIEGTGDSAIFVIKARLFRPEAFCRRRHQSRLVPCLTHLFRVTGRGVHDPQYLETIVRSPDEVLASA